MKIDVRHIAKLAKLKLDEEKIPMFERQMEDILGMVEGLPEISENEKPTDTDNVMELRPDTVGKSLARDELLRGAPQKQAGCIVVPKTVG